MRQSKIIIFVFILLLTSLWGALPIKYNTIVLPVCNVFFILTFIFNYKKMDSLFKRPLFALLIFLVINILYTIVVEGQPVFSTLRGPDLNNICLILSLAFFHKIRISLGDAGQILRWLLWTFCICYIIQYILFPLPIFFLSGTGAEETFVDSGNIRFRMNAQGVIYLAIFYSVYILITSIKKKYIISLE